MLPEGAPGRDVEFVAYGWSRAPIYSSGTSVWSLPDPVFERMVESRAPFWETLTRDSEQFRVHFLTDRAGIYALGYPVITWFGHFVNLAELVTIASDFDEESADAQSIDAFLERISLSAPSDNAGSNEAVVLMTIHIAKGLEWPVVFITGMEDGLFPSLREREGQSEDAQLEEERRLAYVAITRQDIQRGAADDPRSSRPRPQAEPSVEGASS